MADINFFKRKYKSELKSLEISLKAASERTSLTVEEFIQKLAIAKVPKAEIKRLLLDDLKNNGRIFSEYRNAIKATSEGTIGKVSTDAYLSEFGTEIQYTWIAALVRTCKDCLPRHGKIKSFDQWEVIGLPRTGWSVCRENCQCVLIPKEMADGRNELSKPLTRQPRSKK